MLNTRRLTRSQWIAKLCEDRKWSKRAAAKALVAGNQGAVDFYQQRIHELTADIRQLERSKARKC